MQKYILKRLGLMFFTITLIVISVFFLLQLMPGYPKAIEAKIESAKTPEERSAIIASYNTEPNAFLAFFKYIRNVFNGDFGIYYSDTTKTIPQIFITPLGYTLMITGPSFLIGTFFGIICGFISGYKRGKWQDVTVNFFATLFVSIPSFVLAMFLLIFGNSIGLPISFRDAQETGETILAAILPVLIISLTSFSTLTYYIRNEVISVLTSDFILTARTKGLSEVQIFFKHVIKNVSLPFIAIVFPSFLGIIFGSMIIEVFFDVPGSSHVFVSAISKREKNVIMFSTIFFTSFGLLINLTVDILYAVFDPRIKMGQKSYFSFSRRIKSLKNRRESIFKKPSGEGVVNE